MYRCRNGQISLADSKQPVGVNLKEKPLGGKSQTIPWLEIEKRYAAMFTKRKGKMNMLFALENLILADRPCPAVR